MHRLGYRNGVLTGSLICTTGSLLFIPVASVLVYGFFLVALIVSARGQYFLEVAANPYVKVLRPSEGSERRLNFSQCSILWGPL